MIVLATVADPDEERKILRSQFRISRVPPGIEPIALSEPHPERAFPGHFNTCCDAVIGLARRIVKVEMVDKLTDQQITAKVKEHFVPDHPDDGCDRRSPRRALM